MSKNGWIIFSALCIALLGGLIFVSQRNKADVSAVNEHSVQAANANNGSIADHVYGNKDSKVILIEYGDFQCPGCGSAYAVVKNATEAYRNKIGFVFRSFPLTTIHPNALAASSVAEAAGLQGKYWEMHDKLYENQSAWKDLTGQARTDYFKQLAEQVGVNVDQWLVDLDSERVQKKISYDQSLGKKAGVSGTPAFFINGNNVGDQYFEGDKLVAQKTDTSQLVWSDATAFENLVIIPALKNAGISTD